MTKISNERIVSLLEDARRRLVEIGTRNRLIHVKRDSKRSNTLNIINERADSVFDILRANGNKMKFVATVRDNKDDADRDELSLAFDENEEFHESRYTDQFLETRLTPDGLQKRLLRLASDSKTAEEEQGVNILYLAIGFMSWFEDKNSAVTREAPLVLLPVELIRNERRSTYDIKCRDDDVVTNMPLQERLKTDFGINMPEIDDSDAWTPSNYFERVRKAISGKSRWSIDQDGMQLGFFSFSKLLMLRDLDPENWPCSSLMQNELVQKLLEGSFESEQDLFGDGKRLDDHLLPSDIFHVVDADASQTTVIEEVRSGRNMVVQGPPGTGKSQTITNILAAAAHDGKTVLFVAEKMAALEVVHNRMVKVGLQDLCLELHSRNANKKALLHELARTLSNGRSVPSLPKNPDELRIRRDQLNQIADFLHTKIQDHDYSPFEAMASIVGFYGREVPPPQINVEALEHLTNANHNDLVNKVVEYAKIFSQAGTKTEHPFYGTQNYVLQPTELQRLEREIGLAIASINALVTKLNDIVVTTSLDFGKTVQSAETMIKVLQCFKGAPSSINNNLSILYQNCADQRLREGLAAGKDWQVSKKKLSDTFSDAAWNYPVAVLRPHLVKGVGSFFSRIFGKYRSTSLELSTLLKGPIPKVPAERVSLVDQLIGVQKKQKLFEDDEGYLKDKLAGTWRGERTDFAELSAAAAWVKELTEQTPNLSEETIRNTSNYMKDDIISVEGLKSLLEAVHYNVNLPLKRLNFRFFNENEDYGNSDLPALGTRLEKMKSNANQYSEWAHLASCAERLTEAGLADLIELLDGKKITPEEAVDEFLYATAEARWQYARACLPELDALPNIDRHDLVNVFCKLDRNRIKDVQTLIRAKHLDQLPQGASGEMGFLRGEMAKKRRHRPIRKIVEAAGSMVQRIKPVFLMSPISVAQFLPPGSIGFDLLVIDEASQVRPEDALGAIARAKQIVVVGDQKQLPPTSFFERLTDNVEDEDPEETADGVPVVAAKAVEMESILSLCEARGLKQSMLEWHYRSRDPSLITISNKEFYGDRLILPPSPLRTDDNFGLKFRRVPGIYSSKSRGGGRPGTNRIEAELVAKALADHARAWPELSIGIVTFSKAQADIMTEVIEFARRHDDVLDAFLREGKAEDVFVKNIENIQGDERDAILISVGYGPNEPNGRLASMNFGPVNGEGGDRRLNVLFSRARVRCEVFASFDPGEIDLNRTSKKGPRVLKRFLEYSKSGEIDERIATGGDADSPFEEDVARVIASLGYEVDLQVGSAGFKIDLGVRNPNQLGQYILAVECDGATYHSALWARERDRLRQDVLEGFGWHFHRIWSTDWFHRRDYEKKRLEEALVVAKDKASDGFDIKGANSSSANISAPAEEEIGQDEPKASIKLEPIELSVPSYQKSQFTMDSRQELHEFSIQQLCEFAVSIVRVEGPIHTDEVARRIANGFGKSRTGSRIQDAVLKGLLHAHGQGLLKSNKDFWFNTEQEDNIPIRNRGNEAPPTSKAEYLSEIEIQAAASLIERESGAVELDEMVRSISRLLGFRRAGPDLQTRVRNALKTD